MGTSTMADGPIHSGEFNQAIRAIHDKIETAMENVSDKFQALSKEFTEMKASLTVATEKRLEEAQAKGRLEAEVDHIKHQLDRQKVFLATIGAALGGQLLWLFVSKVFH